MPRINALPSDSAPDPADMVPMIDVDADRTESVTLANLAKSTAFDNQYPPRWQASTAYTTGDVVVNEWGETVVAKYDHTSATAYSAFKWTTVGSPDGGTLIDFTGLPDGALSSVRPVYGHIDDFSISDGEDDFAISGGRLIGLLTGDRDNLYLQIECNDTIQHAWAVFDVSESPAQNLGLLILLADEPWGREFTHRAAVHTQIFANLNGVTTNGVVQTGPYSVPGASTSTGSVNLPYSIVGEHIRYDVTSNKLTGEIRYYINGVLVRDYVDPALIGYTGPFAMLEINGDNYSILEYGASPIMPAIMPDQRHYNSSNYIADPVLSSTYKPLHKFYVNFGRSGSVWVHWSAYISQSSGVTTFGIGTDAEGAPSASPAYKNEMVSGAFTGRVAFTDVYVGTPGTTEYLVIYGKTTGTASIGNSTKGGVGPVWMPVTGPTTFNV